MTATATLTVDLDALAHNVHALAAISGAPVHPVVKAELLWPWGDPGRATPVE
ncbi:hypothetical protein MMB232_01748 [Brevundimonas subvibrioides]